MYILLSLEPLSIAFIIALIPNILVVANFILSSLLQRYVKNIFNFRLNEKKPFQDFFDNFWNIN
jgi:hypothetical protein